MLKKSVIDFILLSEDMIGNLDKIIVDEEKEFSLESIVKRNKAIEIKKTRVTITQS